MFKRPLDDYRSATAVLTATTADDTTIDSDKIPKKGITALHFTVTGTNQQFSNFTRFQIIVNGRLVIDFTPTQLKAYLQRFSWANYVPADADVSWTIPMMLPDESGRRAEEQQLEPGDVTVTLTKNATGAAGTVKLAWSLAQPGVQPKFYFRAIRGVLNASASQSAEEKEVKRRGLVRGIILNTTGLNEVVAEAKATVKTPKEFAEFAGIFLKSTGDFMIQLQKLDGGTTVTNPIGYKIRQPVPGDLIVYKLNTAAGWAGVTNELVTILMVPAGMEKDADPELDDAMSA